MSAARSAVLACLISTSGFACRNLQHHEDNRTTQDAPIVPYDQNRQNSLPALGAVPPSIEVPGVMKRPE